MMRARKRFGQHFLEPTWVHKVVEASAPRPSDQFLEIGAGAGALTIALAARVTRIVAIEIDRDLAGGLIATVPPNVRVVTGDFLELDVPSLLWGEFVDPMVHRMRVIGNLPYNVSSPILFELMRYGARFADATLMLQREVADRLLAKPGSREYGVLTVLAAVHARVDRLLDLPPGAFRPPPKVRSTVVRMEFHPPLVDPAALPRFERLVRGAFQQRRKTLLNGIRGAFPELDTAAVIGALTRAGVEPSRRVETLEVTELTRLAELMDV